MLERGHNEDALCNFSRVVYMDQTRIQIELSLTVSESPRMEFWDRGCLDFQTLPFSFVLLTFREYFCVLWHELKLNLKGPAKTVTKDYVTTAD